MEFDEAGYIPVVRVIIEGPGKDLPGAEVGKKGLQGGGALENVDRNSFPKLGLMMAF